MTVPRELSILLRDTLRDESVSKILESSPKLRRLIRRMYDEIQSLLNEDEDDQSVFPVKSGTETKLLRTYDIYFFEAQGRKVALRTRAQEISFYSSFEQIMSQVPDWFWRCHRGYIVNTKRIQSVNFAESTILLADGSSIPFSRSYRDAARAVLDKLLGNTAASADLR